ncbi:lytic transglycosylase domain-containing protein [Pseudophaeobacter sp.]|uniref:lytic transglycosylase domain-containing protein n=1 Tax=Pseudophaeobacter sp. TaxID=1971739 RepID=UPI00329A2984
MIRARLLGLKFFFAAFVLALGVGDSAAQQLGQGSAKPAPPAFPKFEARRVVAPKPGAPPKITIQIEEPQPEVLSQPQAPSAGEGTGTGAGAITGEIGRYAWFWQKVPVGMQTESAHNRLELALTALRTTQTPVSAPSLQMMQQIIAEQAVPILLSSAGTQVSPALVLAVIAVESEGKGDAVSGAGATGLMQLMPDTAARFGVSDVLVAEQNISGGIQYLDWLLEEFAGDAVLALAGYNAGEGAVRAHQGVPPFAETRDYVPKVLAAYQVARALCLTPPELISDGCVFRQIK